MPNTVTPCNWVYNNPMHKRYQKSCNTNMCYFNTKISIRKTIHNIFFTCTKLANLTEINFLKFVLRDIFKNEYSLGTLSFLLLTIIIIINHNCISTSCTYSNYSFHPISYDINLNK